MKNINHNLDTQINNLEAGQSLRLGGNDQVWTTAERSGDGKTLRFVRHTPTSSTIFKSCKF